MPFHMRSLLLTTSVVANTIPLNISTYVCPTYVLHMPIVVPLAICKLGLISTKVTWLSQPMGWASSLAGACSTYFHNILIARLLHYKHIHAHITSHTIPIATPSAFSPHTLPSPHMHVHPFLFTRALLLFLRAWSPLSHLLRNVQ